MSGFITVPGFRSPRVIAASGAKLTNTGDTNENTLVTATIPAGSLGPNGFVRVWTLWTTTANTNTKTGRIRFGGTAFLGAAQTSGTGQTMNLITIIQNRNATNSQIGGQQNHSGVGIGISGAVTTGAIDTTADVSLTITAQCAVGTDTIDLERYFVEVCYAP